MFFHSSKGVIALDIDGTVTAHAHELDSKVIDALDIIAKQGWHLIFITGRPFQWGLHTLGLLPFSYAIAVQNGALLVEMPSRNILVRKSLTSAILPKLEELSREYQTPFIIYSGFENEDWCYYRFASPLSPEIAYGLKRAEYLGEKWQSIPAFSDLPISHFSSIKFFIDDDRAFIISRRIENEVGLHAPPNRDPYNPNFYVVQGTHSEATKGHALREFIQYMGITGPIIAAGDDYNDQSMLNIADIKIVMANAPSDLLKIADIVAPPATENGIIRGLQEAIVLANHLGGKNG